MTATSTRPSGAARPASRRDGVAGPAPARGGPDLARFLGLIARAALEVRAGRRPASQLRGVVSPAVEHRLCSQPGHLVGAGVPSPTAGSVRSVCTHRPSPGVCEATVMVDTGERITALALRAERHEGSWRIVEIAAPESGLAPLRTPGPTR